MNYKHSDLWSAHCRQCPSVHIFGTKADVLAWVEVKRADSCVLKMDSIGEPFTWVTSPPGGFIPVFHDAEEEQWGNRVSGDDAYYNRSRPGTLGPLGAYDEALLNPSGRPIDWFKGERT